MAKAILTGELVYSDMEAQGGTVGTLQIKAGSTGTVTISVKAQLLIPWKAQMVRGLPQTTTTKYDHNFEYTWEVEADLNGNLKISAIGKPRWMPFPGQPLYQITTVEHDENEKAGIVQITAYYVGGQSTSVPPSIGVKGADIPLGGEVTSPAGTFPQTFRLNLKVIDIPHVPPPTSKVRIGPIWKPSCDVLFDAPKNGVGQHTLSNAQTQADKLIAWYLNLNGTLRGKIEAGDIPVLLEGRASRTGKPLYNLGLSDLRNKEVERILRKVLGVDAKFKPKAFGEWLATTQDEVESDNERKVIVSVFDETFSLP